MDASELIVTSNFTAKNSTSYPPSVPDFSNPKSDDLSPKPVTSGIVFEPVLDPLQQIEPSSTDKVTSGTSFYSPKIKLDHNRVNPKFIFKAPLFFFLSESFDQNEIQKRNQMISKVYQALALSHTVSAAPTHLANSTGGPRFETSSVASGSNLSATDDVPQQQKSSSLEMASSIVTSSPVDEEKDSEKAKQDQPGSRQSQVEPSSPRIEDQLADFFQS